MRRPLCDQTKRNEHFFLANLIKKAVTLDAEFEVYLQPKNEIQAENPKKDDSLIQETYGKLLEFGVDQSKAWELANNYPNLEEALNHAF